MSPAWVRPRAVKSSLRNPRGKTFQVLYRRGGREYPIESAGTFKSLKDARIRRDLVSGWIAAGLNPRDELRKLTLTPPKIRTVREWLVEYQASRIDLADQTLHNVRSHVARINASAIADRDPSTLTVADIQAFVVGCADLKPSSMKRYLTTLKLALDFAGVDPNPARDRALRLPQVVRTESTPPTADQLVRMLNAMPKRYWLPLITLEQTAMRVGEATSLVWGDVDETSRRFRLRSAETKSSRPRWVQVPGWLMDEISARCPREDRVAERRVFPAFTADVAKNAMARACVTAGIPHFHPHDLRHRRATIWHHEGVPARVMQERGGWSRATIALDVYSHLMPIDEVPQDTLDDLLVRSR